MADDKLKTGPEPPGLDHSGDVPAEEAPSMQEPPAQETSAPEKAEEPVEPEQSVIPGMGKNAPPRPAPGEVVVDFDKINELMSQRRAAAREAVKKAEAPIVDKSEAPAPETKTPEAEKTEKHQGRPPKEQAGPDQGNGTGPRTGRPSKADKAARGESPSPALDKVVCSQ